jgi:hypothetical protein
MRKRHTAASSERNYITRGELVELLRRDKGDEGLKNYGKRIGVSGALIGGILRGDREPGPKVAAYFGFPEPGFLRRRRA